MLTARFKLVGLSFLAFAFALAASACSKDSASDENEEVAALTSDDEAPLMPTADMIARAKARTTAWPIGEHDWPASSAADQVALIAKPECRDFESFMFPSANADAETAARLGKQVDDLESTEQALRTDGAIIIKDGRIIYEHYVGPYAGHPERRHCVWSASKSVSTAIMGAIVQASEDKAAGRNTPGGQLLANGGKLGLDTRIRDLLDPHELGDDPRIAELTVSDLLGMNMPTPQWNEGYDGKLQTSSVVKMLWMDGPRDMARYAAGALMTPGAIGGKAFRYSSGNAVVLMRALKALYGAEYEKMPWTVLFDELGMKSAVLERDQKGVFVGSSYAHMTLRDMARLGFAHLNGGWFGGRQVIHPAFIDAARVVGPAMRNTDTSEDTIIEEEAFYGIGWWLNPSPQILARQNVRQFSPEFPARENNKRKRGEKLFPSSPTDVFFAAGHYGQNIIIFPKDDLMIVRMSHDNEYFSKLDRIMVKARACVLGSR